jgi:hypothetical protein
MQHVYHFNFPCIVHRPIASRVLPVECKAAARRERARDVSDLNPLAPLSTSWFAQTSLLVPEHQFLAVCAVLRETDGRSRCCVQYGAKPEGSR